MASKRHERERGVGSVALPFLGIVDGFGCRRGPSLVALDCDGRFGGFVAGSVLAGVVAVGLIVYAIALQVVASEEVSAWLRRLRGGASGVEVAHW